MKVQPPPGMRDFYPDDMSVQRWLVERWRSASRAFGFSEYDGPIFEFQDLYTIKSGAEILEQLFTLEDRGGRRFALRPEMTPTLARMVAARANALPRPIKWFSVPRLCRAEKPQRGRLREFFQWNVDVLGVDDPLADAETIAVAVEFLRGAGLGDGDVVIRVSDRRLAGACLSALGVPPERHAAAFEVIDRMDRLEPAEFDRRWQAVAGAKPAPEALRRALEGMTREGCGELARGVGPQAAAAADQFDLLWERLAQLDAASMCTFDLRIVRGLAYYTGVVFEAHCRDVSLRALLGGGRYDDLTGLLGGPTLPGVGFGMGDAPVLEALRALDRLPAPQESLDAFVIDADATLFPAALKLAGELRRAGLAVDFSYKRQPVGKQFAQASARGARYAIVVGVETIERDAVTVKNLATGGQSSVSRRELTADSRRFLP